MENYYIEAKLDDETTVLVECVGHSAEEDVAFSVADLNPIFKTIGSFSKTIQSALEQAKPQKVTVEFGLSVNIKSGNLMAVLVNGDANANLKLALTWEDSK